MSERLTSRKGPIIIGVFLLGALFAVSYLAQIRGREYEPLDAYLLRTTARNELHEQWKKSGAVSYGDVIGKAFHATDIKPNVPITMRFHENGTCSVNETLEGDKALVEYSIEEGTLIVSCNEGKVRFRRDGDRLWWVDEEICANCNKAHSIHYNDWN